MEAHQQRVVDEKNELDEKATKLADFFTSDLYSSIGDAEKARLEAQYKVMQEYSHILGARIAAF